MQQVTWRLEGAWKFGKYATRTTDLYGELHMACIGAVLNLEAVHLVSAGRDTI